MSDRVVKRAAPGGGTGRIVKVNGVDVTQPAQAKPKAKSLRKHVRHEPSPQPVVYEQPATKAPARVTRVGPAVTPVGVHALRSALGCRPASRRRWSGTPKATVRMRAAAEKAAQEQRQRIGTDVPAAAAPQILHRPSPVVSQYAPTGERLGPAQPSDQ